MVFQLSKKTSFLQATVNEVIAIHKNQSSLTYWQNAPIFGG